MTRQPTAAQPDLFSSASPSREDMERAFAAGDASCDGTFVAAIRSTGVFCRPSCDGRKPPPGALDFFASIGDALDAGYRPCLRCRPTLPAQGAPEWLTRLLDAIDAEPGWQFTDADAAAFGVDPSAARRYFVEHFGMPIQAYCRGRRRSGAQRLLQNADAADADTEGTGWSSPAEFHASFTRVFGTAPMPHGTGDVITTAFETPLGPMLAGAVDDGLCLLEFTDRRILEAHATRLRGLLKHRLVAGDHPHLTHIRDELARYFEGTLTAFTVPIVFNGTAFEERVWHALTRIPYGETSSYAQLAAAIDVPNGQRAVGRANGLNRISIVIPCHRVVNGDGALGGYGGGLWRKHWLLALERRPRTTAHT